MDAAAVSSCVAGAMEALLPKLATLLEKKYGLPKGIKEKIASMRDEMNSMNALLMKLSQMEELDEEQKDWRDKVRELSLHRCLSVAVCGFLEPQISLVSLTKLELNKSWVFPKKKTSGGARDEDRWSMQRRWPCIIDREQDRGSRCRGLAHHGVAELQGGGRHRDSLLGRQTSGDGSRTGLEKAATCTALPPYLIVIDDLWATEAWNTIKNCFVENNRCSRVITTTRIERVAQACCSRLHDHVYKIQPLNVPDSRRLFHRRIFLSNDACPEHLRNVSDEILKKCQGVPLAILSVASTLYSHGRVMLKENWEAIRDHLGDHLETDSEMNCMRHVLNLGYNDLSLDLKTCLLYLGIFPEDSIIMKDDLIRRWIAGCFVSGKNTYGPEEVADSYFNELINRNMIQMADYDDCGEVASCRVHDLMLDFIISKSTEENFMTVINGQRSAKGTLEPRQVSVQLSNSEPNNRLENMPLTQVRSLYFWGPAQLMPSFSKFQLLRVLYLDVSDAKYEHCYLSSIGSLFQLRYLKTRGIPYEQVLTRLQNLQRLKTLEIAEDDGIDGMADYFVLDVCLLPSTLMHLIVTASVELVGGIGRMRALHTLATLQVNLGDVETMKGLCDLSNLRDLKLLRCTSGVEDTCDLLVSALCRLSSLKSLAFRGFPLDDDALTRWSPPPADLYRLHVVDCPFLTVSDWLTQLDKLTSLEVRVQLLPRDGAELLAKLTSLVHLRLHTRAQAPEEGVVIRGAMFPYLKNFWFRCKVPCLIFEAGAMPRIQSLTVECHVHAERHTNDILHGIEHLGSLKTCKMFAYERGDFMSQLLCSSYFSESHVEEVRRWDLHTLLRTVMQAISFFCPTYNPEPHVKKVPRWNLQTLETAVRQAINKHPGCPDISFEDA